MGKELKQVWTKELETELRVLHGVDVDQVMLDILNHEIEIERQKVEEDLPPAVQMMNWQAEQGKGE